MDTSQKTVDEMTVEELRAEVTRLRHEVATNVNPSKPPPPLPPGRERPRNAGVGGELLG